MFVQICSFGCVIASRRRQISRQVIQLESIGWLAMHKEKLRKPQSNK